jgi:hypothetical protein
MVSMKGIASVVVAGSLAMGAASFAAAAQQSGLVNVHIQDVAQDIANNLKVNISDIPVTVQAPIGVAANVCGVNANVLAQQKPGGTAECKATSTNTALNQIVQKQIGGKTAAAK